MYNHKKECELPASVQLFYAKQQNELEQCPLKFEQCQNKEKKNVAIFL